MKTKNAQSVLQDWVMQLPLREQGVLLTAIRGGDLTPKHPYDAPERQIVGWIRNATLNPADRREVGIEGAFFQTNFPKFKWSEFGHYPLHFIVHVAHALEVIGYRHPAPAMNSLARGCYYAFCHSLHMSAESKDVMVLRLSQDRIANGNVVS